jgi:hypothetical protein
MRLSTLALAIAAFGVALASLYLGNVKRADISLIVLPGLRSYLPSQQRREEGPPVSGEVAVRMAVINSGARAGLLTSLTVERKRERFVEIQGGHPVPNSRDGELGALPLQSGETKPFILQVACEFPDEAVAAWKSGEFHSFGVGVSYAYLRGKRIRAIGRRKLTVPILIDDLAWRP